MVSIRKQYAGHARRVMMGVWSFLRQFMYTKFIIVVDDDVNIRDWKEVVWAMTTRMDATRDTMLVDNTPIDYLDFASPVAGLGSKMGLDATNKWPGETNREWGTPITHDPGGEGTDRCDVGRTRPIAALHGRQLALAAVRVERHVGNQRFRDFHGNRDSPGDARRTSAL